MTDSELAARLSALDPAGCRWVLGHLTETRPADVTAALDDHDKHVRFYASRWRERASTSSRSVVQRAPAGDAA